MTYYSNYKFLKLNYNRNIPLSNMKSLKKQLKTVLLEKKKKVIKSSAENGDKYHQYQSFYHDFEGHIHLMDKIFRDPRMLTETEDR